MAVTVWRSTDPVDTVQLAREYNMSPGNTSPDGMIQVKEDLVLNDYQLERSLKAMRSWEGDYSSGWWVDIGLEDYDTARHWPHP